MISLTDEQKSVVYHPIGNHAKVLAVAGSGKTSTLVYRIKHLILEQQTKPANIQILMFNKLARQQFKEKMTKIGIPLQQQPKVATFHSFAYGVVQKLMREGKMAEHWNFWIDSKEETARITLKRVIASLEKDSEIPANSIDIEEAYQAIQLWKGSLIPPPRAGYKGNKLLPRIYELYEEERIKTQGLTYDDFIPITIAFFEHHPKLLEQYNRNLQHLIVDEYQDVNYGQQRLIELLAANNADVMVVGDDDQTIYEWRGARPNYIIREFQSIFTNKPVKLYKLSRSFRFGAVIAQCAHNSIAFNRNRVSKSLISDDLKKPAHIILFEQSSNQDMDTNKALTEQVVTLVKNNGVPPSQIIVLCRMYAQLSGIEAEFMNKKIPYRIVGQKPFFKRREITVLLDYIWLSIHYHDPVTEQTKKKFLNIANTPNRMLTKTSLEESMNLALLKEKTLSEALESLIINADYSLNNRQKTKVLKLIKTFEQASKQIVSQKPTDVLLTDLVSSIDYFAHFDAYYGKGELSFDRKENILNFIEYVKKVDFSPSELLAHVATLDTTRGAPEDQQIVMTTIFRTKGLEFDYVIIPNCNEGYMPNLYTTNNQIFDTSGNIKEPEPSSTIESERRLFYVAITRAKKAVYIGTTTLRKNSRPSRFIDEIQYNPTVKIMGTLQRIAQGEENAKHKFLSLVTQFAGIKSVMRSLLSHYLIELKDQSLIKEVTSIVASSHETPFKYRIPYSSLPPEETTNKHEQHLHAAWNEINQ